MKFQLVSVAEQAGLKTRNPEDRFLVMSAGQEYLPLSDHEYWK